MTSNFNYIAQSSFRKLADTLGEAEKYVHVAPIYTAILCRKSLEEWVRWLYANDVDLDQPYDTSLNSLLHHQEFKDLLAPNLFRLLNVVKKLGNDAVHTKIKIEPKEALHVLQIMHGFTQWVVKSYSDERIVIPPFDESLVPRDTPIIDFKERIRVLEAQFQEVQKILREKEEEIERIRKIKSTNERQPPPQDPNEDITRKLYINTLLTEAGWDPHASDVAEYPVTGMPTGDGQNNGPGFVDYVLWGDNGKPLAVVEAKRTSKDARIGANQAKLYADCLERMKGQRPIIFFTNGFETYIWDDVWYPAREVQGFYSKEELELLIQRRTTRLSLTAASVDANIADRYYQIEAIRSVARVLENRGRDALLVMATGTGKTRTAAALVDVLSKSNWAKRTLFLADRSALVHQAKKAFVNLLPNLPAIDLTKEKDSLHARVVFSTYQTLINLIDNEYDEDKRHFGVGHFDLIIFDEIHRSVYNKYRAIFQYFDGYRIGLTATPKSEGDRDTYHLFGLEPNVPTFAYELDQAVMDKFLVPPFKISVPVKFHREGIKYADLTPEEKLNYEETFRDPITETLPDEISSAALNKWLFNESTVDQVLSYLMTKGIKVAGGDRLGKTIIFARSHQHAEFIKLRFDKQYPHFGGHFCSVIDIYEGSKYAFDLIEKFSQKDSYPHIAISVDMMDTGIDIPECVNLVFYKPVKSRTKFWQMIGRGTRLCKDLFGPSQDKDKFIIFDFCENFEFFDFNPEGVKDSKVRSLTERLFHQRLKLLFLLQRKQEESLASYADELAAYMHQQVNRLEEENFVVRQHWRFVEKYRDPFQWNALTELDLKELLDHLAPIVSEKDDDERSKSFDVLCYALQIEVVQRGSVSASLMDQVITLMGQLSKKGAIPAVAARMTLIKEVQLKQYWAEPTVPKFEHLRKELRSIIRYIDKEKGVIYHTNFTDEILSFVEEPSPVSATMDLETYKRRVTEYLERNRHHVTIHKLRTNQPISNSELRSLETMLFEQGDIGTRDHFVRAYGDQPLGTFIRTILGLDIEAANQAFSGFINNPSLNASQIRFVNLLIQYLTTNGVITAERLFQPPFTDISTNGLLGVFQGREAETIVRTIDSINQSAVAQ